MYNQITGMNIKVPAGSLTVDGSGYADHAGIIVRSPVNSEHSPVPGLPGSFMNVYLKYVVPN